jgi:hypothetical protein
MTENTLLKLIQSMGDSLLNGLHYSLHHGVLSYLPFINHNHYSMASALIVFILIITLILTLLYLLNFFISISSKDEEKLSTYECGFEPLYTNARVKFDILYWIIGILYLIFDLELIFIFP